MTLDRAGELLAVQADFSGFYNGNSAKFILSEVQREYRPGGADQLIMELHLENILGFKLGTHT